MSGPSPRTLLDYLQTTTKYFRDNGVEAPRLEAEMLLAHVLGIPRIQLYVRFEQPLGEAEVAAYRELVKRRRQHEPVQYILGRREFWSLDFQVERGVLIPRADTEVLVEEALAILKGVAAPRIGEVGVGSGAISVSLLKELEAASGWACDIAEVPLAVAGRNAAAHGVARRLTLVHGDGVAAIAPGGPFDLLVSNPPYVREADVRRLPPHIKSWEPMEALVSGADGLDCLRAIAAGLSEAVVKTGGAVVLEIGDEPQAREVSAWLAPRFEAVRVRKDYAGGERAVVATGFRG